MQVWLVNPFDPLPGESEQLGRYGFLVRCLRARGHSVTWWSSKFSHRFKRYVDERAIQAAARDWGVAVRLLDTPPYKRNVSIQRLRNHRVLGQAFLQQAGTEPPPDMILASSPPLETADVAARLGHERSVPVVLDVQDQWPDNFRAVAPSWLRPFAGLLLRPYYGLERRAATLATGLAGVARGYVNRALSVGGPKRWQGVFPLGVDLEDVRAAARRGAAQYAEKWRKPDGEIWLLYSGSHTRAYDFLTIVRAAVPALQQYGNRVRFILTGTGELAPLAHDLVRENQLSNVTLGGFLEFAEWAYLLTQVDAGFNASFPEALIYLPNKIFYYLAVGAAVLNTIPGECADIISSSGCGLNYTAGDVASCFGAVRQVIDSPEQRRAMQTASRRLAEEKYDRRLVYAEFVQFLEDVAAAGPRADGPRRELESTTAGPLA